MQLKSERKVVHKPQQTVFDYLTEYENYENLMPENTQKFEVHPSGNGFNVQLKGLPKVGMKLKETNEPNSIIFESPNPDFSYELKVNLDKIDDDNTEVSIDFDGKFNPMIEMMAKSPLQKFINTLIENLS